MVKTSYQYFIVPPKLSICFSFERHHKSFRSSIHMCYDEHMNEQTLKKLSVLLKSHKSKLKKIINRVN